jgi:hypothetical protein
MKQAKNNKYNPSVEFVNQQAIFKYSFLGQESSRLFD